MEDKNTSRHKTLHLPAWVAPFVEAWPNPLTTPQERMRLAIALSAENLAQGTGGPFASLVSDPVAGQLIAVGVNVVVPQHASLAHGEMMAIVLAQDSLGTHDLASVKALELVTTSQPCLQCYGAVIWSGLRKVVVGARGSDVEEIAGFDEGPMPSDWVGEWAKRGITAEVDVLRSEACAVLHAYKASGSLVYNSTGSLAQD